MSNIPMIKEDNITDLIYVVRGVKVMFDFDLANLYGVETKGLKAPVRRNIGRFPKDFMFILTFEEFKILRSQFASSNFQMNTNLDVAICVLHFLSKSQKI